MRRKIPVTVLIPAYNAERFLRGSIGTVRAQSVDVDEIIVVDDESSDDTAALAEQLGARVVRIPHGGNAVARNAGLDAAKSEWIAFLDADDFWHPRKLELQYNAILTDPELGIVCSDFDAVSVVDGRIQGSNVISSHEAFKRIKRRQLTSEAYVLDFEDFLRESPARAMVLPSSTLVRRELATKVRFPLGVKAEDSEFFLRLSACTSTAFLQVPLVAYMRHDSQITSNWALDSVRLALVRHVLLNPTSYHPLIVSSFEKDHANALYYCAAGAAANKQIGLAFRFLVQALITAVRSGNLLGIARTISQSQIVRSRLPWLFGKTLPDVEVDLQTCVREIDIPWREKIGYLGTLSSESQI
jgi:glycosyltransferase involved in cell wall biosynthesis